jgi:hypothetical protein
VPESSKERDVSRLEHLRLLGIGPNFRPREDNACCSPLEGSFDREPEPNQAVQIRFEKVCRAKIGQKRYTARRAGASGHYPRPQSRTKAERCIHAAGAVVNHILPHECGVPGAVSGCARDERRPTLRVTPAGEVGISDIFMDERELLLERLRKSVEDSKRLKAELEQTVAMLSKLIETVEGAKDTAERIKGQEGHP